MDYMFFKEENTVERTMHFQFAISNIDSSTNKKKNEGVILASLISWIEIVSCIEIVFLSYLRSFKLKNKLVALKLGSQTLFKAWASVVYMMNSSDELEISLGTCYGLIRRRT